MAQSITLMNATYNDVPAVDLPKTGGGTARFTDVTESTVEAADVAEGKIFFDSNGVRRVGTMSAGPYSFIGMVVSGTNLTTEASVKALYGSGTSWSLISSVMLASENIVGNGYTLGLTEGTTLGGMRARGDNAAPSLYGKPVGSTNITGTMSGSVGVPTKSQLGNTPQYSGIIADTVQVYSWERTA